MLLSELSDGDYSDLVSDVLDEQVSDLKSLKLRIEAGTYKRLFWSRICTLQTALTQSYTRYSIEDDLLEELQQYDDRYVQEDDDWELLYSPKDFNDEFKPLAIDKYKLTQEQLRQYAVQLSQIRQRITEKAHQCD